MKKPTGNPIEIKPEPALPGVGTVSMGDFRRSILDEASTPEEWREIFTAKLRAIESHFLQHDPVEIVAKTSGQYMANA